MFTRTRYQNGALEQKRRTDGRTVWEFRFYETGPEGHRERKFETIGSVAEFKSESAARKSAVVQAILLRINSHSRTSLPSFGALIDRYVQEEMPQRYSTSMAYRSYINNYIRPRWAEMPIAEVKAIAVEDWLKRLALAPKSKSHIRSIVHMLFQCAQRWELVNNNPIPLSTCKGGQQTTRSASGPNA